MLCLLIFGLQKKTFPAGRPSDKNRNVIYDNNTCTASRKEGTKTILLTLFLCLFISLLLSETKSVTEVLLNHRRKNCCDVMRDLSVTFQREKKKSLFLARATSLTNFSFYSCGGKGQTIIEKKRTDQNKKELLQHVNEKSFV